MKFTALRHYIKSKNLENPFELQNRDLVIDADCFFKDSYKASGCQFILGADCDTYSDYIANKLGPFLDCNVKCRFIFKGTKNYNIDKHKKIVDDLTNIDLENPKYFEPILVKDVQKQVLDVMGIHYFCCEYDSMHAIVGVARQYKCPVLTDNLEYCLLGVSCVLPNSVEYKDNNILECLMYEHQIYKSALGLFKKMPILLSLFNDNVDFLSKLPHFSDSDQNYKVTSVIRWIKRQRDDKEVAKNFEEEDTSNAFTDLHLKINMLYLYPSHNLAVKYFMRKKPYGLFKDDKKWFVKGVSNGRIAMPYIDIKRRGFISGSTVLNDVHKPDALLAASEIIAYSHCLLTNSQHSTYSFFGRKGTSCCIWEIDTHWSSEIRNREIFNKHKSAISDVNLFRSFFTKALKHLSQLVEVTDIGIPKDCRMLVITLIYYIHKVDTKFVDAAYFILLSYLMLSTVSWVLYRKDNKESDISNKILYDDYQKMYDGLKFLFRKVDLHQNYRIDVLHSLAEFQHCLQHMNYLNKLCVSDIPCTMYHDTVNATFIYNIHIVYGNKNNLMTFLESNFKELRPFKLYKQIISGFERCCHPTEDIEKLIHTNSSLFNL